MAHKYRSYGSAANSNDSNAEAVANIEATNARRYPLSHDELDLASTSGYLLEQIIEHFTAPKSSADTMADPMDSKNSGLADAEVVPNSDDNKQQQGQPGAEAKAAPKHYTKVVRVDRPPLYLQWDGHCVVVVGVEKRVVKHSDRQDPKSAWSDSTKEDRETSARKLSDFFSIRRNKRESGLTYMPHPTGKNDPRDLQASNNNMKRIDDIVRPSGTDSHNAYTSKLGRDEPLQSSSASGQTWPRWQPPLKNTAPGASLEEGPRTVRLSHESGTRTWRNSLPLRLKQRQHPVFFLGRDSKSTDGASGNTVANVAVAPMDSNKHTWIDRWRRSVRLRSRNRDPLSGLSSIDYSGHRSIGENARASGVIRASGSRLSLADAGNHGVRDPMPSIIRPKSRAGGVDANASANPSDDPDRAGFPAAEAKIDATKVVSDVVAASRDSKAPDLTEWNLLVFDPSAPDAALRAMSKMPHKSRFIENFSDENDNSGKTPTNKTTTSGPATRHTKQPSAESNNQTHTRTSTRPSTRPNTQTSTAPASRTSTRASTPPLTRPSKPTSRASLLNRSDSSDILVPRHSYVASEPATGLVPFPPGGYPAPRRATAGKGKAREEISERFPANRPPPGSSSRPQPQPQPRTQRTREAPLIPDAPSTPERRWLARGSQRVRENFPHLPAPETRGHGTLERLQLEECMRARGGLVHEGEAQEMIDHTLKRKNTELSAGEKALK